MTPVSQGQETPARGQRAAAPTWRASGRGHGGRRGLFGLVYGLIVGVVGNHGIFSTLKDR
jgi:hypothetical protein